MKLSKSKIFFVFFLLLLFVKTDYRLVESIYCCKDDHDYYAHAETLSLDFDFDYSNQLIGHEKDRFFFNGKSAPTAFFGSGFLASPFLLIGNLLDKNLSNSSLYNFKILFYSFSSIFYLFLSFYILSKIKVLADSKINTYLIYLYLLGSGVGYYSFERYSMSHIYEVFTILLVIFYSMKFFDENNYKSNIAFIIPLLILLSIVTRWVNLYVLFIPMIVRLLLYKNSKKIIYSKKFQTSIFISILLFCLHSYLIYGVVTFSPEFVYGTSGTLDRFVNNESSFSEFIFNNIINLFKLLFGQEFGLLWFSPIVFFGVYLQIKGFFLNKGFKLKMVYLIGLLSFLQIFALILIWKAPGSSYGFRYALNLAPISILFLISSNFTNRIELTLLKYLSIFSFFSVLFFETTQGTQLSLEYGFNSFGKYTKFVQPGYLTGYISPFFELEAYLKIFAQSYLGLFFFSSILLFLEIDDLTNFLAKFSDAAYNSDLQLLFYKIIKINYYKIVLSILILFLLAYFLVKITNNVEKINKQ